MVHLEQAFVLEEFKAVFLCVGPTSHRMCKSFDPVAWFSYSAAALVSFSPLSTRQFLVLNDRHHRLGLVFRYRTAIITPT